MLLVNFVEKRGVGMTVKRKPIMSDADRLAHKWVKCLLRSEMVRHDVTYTALAKSLVNLGVIEEDGALRNRVSRGKFSAAFFFQCLAAMGTKNVNVELYDFIRGEGTDRKV